MIFSKPPRDRFPDISGKATLGAEDDGISTEPDTWKGLQNLAESTYLSWLALHWFYIQCGVGKTGLPVGHS